MNRSHLWKLLFIVFVVAWACFELYPPAGIPLLADFQEKALSKDTNFTAIVARATELQRTNPDRGFANLREAVGSNDLTKYFPGIPVKGEVNPNHFILTQLQREAAGKIKLGLDLQGGTAFLVGMETNALTGDRDKSAVLSQAVEVLRNRLDKFGVAEPLIQPAGDDKIMVQMPGLTEDSKDQVRQTLQQAAFLEFRMVHPDSPQLLSQDIVEPGYEVLYEERKDRDGTKQVIPYLVKKGAERGLTGKYLTRAGVSRQELTGQPRIDFELNAEGGKLFGELTREYSPKGDKHYQLAIVLDGKLYSAPRINTPIEGGRGVIEGSFTLEEAFRLAYALENPLEAPVKILEERGVDPSLGKDSIASGIKSSIYGILAVAAFMLVYYFLAGAVANVALLLNIIILLGVLCSIKATLTVPGIAGIVLTAGMAVDANVLIFERIREELDAGKSLRGALHAGYSKAFGTILDSNLTTLISSVILIFMGTGPVKGFGVTLTIGIITSMFTALVVTRLIFDFLIHKGLIKSLPMLALVKNTNIDFMRWAKVAFAFSWILIVIGCAWGLKRGHEVMGVDFAGGDSLGLRFTQRVDVDKLREAVVALKVGDPMISYQRDVATAAGKEVLRVTTEVGSGDKVLASLQQQFPQAKFERVFLDRVGPVIGAQILKTALIAMMLAMLGILIYVALRYEFSFAVGAVIAILHDILMTMGWFFLTGRELSAPMVAAVLTIIGFSINDTIVIFDRIREDLKLGVRGTFREVLNKALNQTLSRTIITSGTVFLATLALYIFGGGVINDFAFTFLVGIITGTYSSIYIASALVLWWHKGQRPAIGGSSVALESAAAVREPVGARA